MSIIHMTAIMNEMWPIYWLTKNLNDHEILIPRLLIKGVKSTVVEKNTRGNSK